MICYGKIINEMILFKIKNHNHNKSAKSVISVHAPGYDVVLPPDTLLAISASP